jgi:Uma2 family endonuclease
MASVSEKRATLDDLYRVEGKAELINGRIVAFPLGGDLPSQVALEIAISLDTYAKKVGKGEAYAGGLGYAVAELSSGRESFCPDASYHAGAFPANPMRFIEGGPTFAVEVRGENDYGDAAEEQMAAKRVDYFMAGTLIVWDVDPIAECVHVYRATSPKPNLPCPVGRCQWMRSSFERGAPDPNSFAPSSYDIRMPPSMLYA